MENESATHITRDTRSFGSLPYFRATTTPPSRKLSRPRRKYPTDHLVLTSVDDATDRENICVALDQHTNSVETFRRRSSKSKKITDGTAALSTITSAGARKQKNKSFPSPSIKAPSDKPANIPLSTSSPAILNVGQADVATEIATYLSIDLDAADEPFLWDMDYITTAPSVLSPPRSHSNSSPFSTPIDDDALLEAEIPFPLNRHSKVVLQNMGIKKSKTLARERSMSGGGILNRQTLFPLTEPAIQSQAESELPGLPHPLPLRTLPNRMDAKYPWEETVPHISVQPPHTPEPVVVVPPGSSPSRRDPWGCVHLSAAELELSIVFPGTPHFEVWDVGDNAHMAFPAMLCLIAKDPLEFSGVPLAPPDVSHIDISCEDLPLPLLRGNYDPCDEYATFYTGKKTGTAHDSDDLIGTSSPKSSSSKASQLSPRGISLDGMWVRTYAMPGVEGSGPSPSGPRHKANGVRGWYLKLWVPVPMRLFEKRETRTFNIHGSIWMMGDEQRSLSLDENGDAKVFPLLADAQMTVSHMRKERYMDR